MIVPIWRPKSVEEDMLEWKPRLIVLAVTLITIASVLGTVLKPINLGWGFAV
jgi:hypothetical protein